MPAWGLKWERGAIAMLRELPWREAERVDAAVLRLAETGGAAGAGRIEAVSGDPRGFRLHVLPYVVRFEADQVARVFRIFAVFTRR